MTFVGSDFQKAFFLNAIFTQCLFKKCLFEETDLSNVWFVNSIFETTKYLSGAGACRRPRAKAARTANEHTTERLQLVEWRYRPAHTAEAWGSNPW